MKRTLLLAFMVTAAYGQSLSYSLLPDGESAPSPRVDGTIAYDPASQNLYLFGGQDSEPRNDLWVYTLAERRWSRVTVTGESPAARFGHTLLWDARRSRLVVFGGQLRGFFSDVWAFDVSRGSWQQLARDEAGPSRRYGHSAVYDAARDRMVISHGFTNSGRFDDTWAFDFASNSWRNLTPSGTRPLRRCLHHAVLDAARGEMLLYGGCASGFGPCPLGDLWSFDLAANRWTEKTGQVKPPAREHYGMVFDETRGRLVVFGGSGGGLLNDTWEYAGTQWRESAIEGARPRARHRHEGTFGSFAFFFGGRTDSGDLTNELWMLGPALAGPRILGVASAFGNVVGPVAPGQLVTIFGSGLGPAEGVALALDAGMLPRSGPGVTVRWNGTPSPVLFARSDQLNVQVPYESSGLTEARVEVTVNGATTSLSVPVAPTRPSLFAGVWNQDGSLNSAANPARAGDVVVLYATGQGVTVPASRTGTIPDGSYPEPVAPVSVTIGGVPAEILFRGQAPGTVGVMQLNLMVPRGASGGNVILRIGEGESQTGVIVYI
jgi:uncharacterized protein (TIGR03437 family)